MLSAITEINTAQVETLKKQHFLVHTLMSYIDGVVSSEDFTPEQETTVHEHKQCITKAKTKTKRQNKANNKGKDVEKVSIQKELKETDEMLTTYKKAVFRRKANSWELRYRRDYLDKSFTAKTQKECKDKFDLWLSQNKAASKKPKSITVQQWYEKWIEVYKKPKTAPATITSIHYAMRKNVIAKIGDTEMSKVTNVMLQELIYSMEATGNSRHKVKIYLGDMFKQATKNKIIKENVADGLEENSTPYKEGVPLTKLEQDHLIKHPNETLLKKYYIFTMLTGCRRQEALDFTPEDIQGDKLHIPGTKTKNTNKPCADRYIPYFKSVKQLLKSIPMTAGVPIFNFKAQFVTRNAKKYLPNNHTVKDLRTTFATYCNEIGIDTKIIQKWMGHSTDTMTKQRYIKIQEDYEVSEMKKLDKFFPNFSPKK